MTSMSNVANGAAMRNVERVQATSPAQPNPQLVGLLKQAGLDDATARLARRDSCRYIARFGSCPASHWPQGTPKLARRDFPELAASGETIAECQEDVDNNQWPAPRAVGGKRPQ